jgi:hypothetical protein
MGILAAEDGVHPNYVALPVERFQIVGYGEQVHLGWKFVGGVPQ